MNSLTIFVEYKQRQPSSIRVADSGRWSPISAYAFPRDKRAELLHETSRPGVYILVGRNKAGHRAYYIGHSEKVSSMLSSHNDDEDTSFWEETIVLAVKGLSARDVQYAQARIASSAKENTFWQQIYLGKAPKIAVKLKKRDEEKVEKIVIEIKMLVEALGLDLFSNATNDKIKTEKDMIPEPQAGISGTIFCYASQAYDARMVPLKERRFVILKGSKVRKEDLEDTPHNAARLRRQLIESGDLIPKGNLLEFQSNCNVTSASTAGAVVSATSVNGHKVWKTPNGQTYGEWKKQQRVRRQDP